MGSQFSTAVDQVSSWWNNNKDFISRGHSFDKSIFHKGHKQKENNIHINSQTHVLYIHFDHTLLNSLHRLVNCEIGGLDCHIITTEYRTRVQCIHM